MVLIVLRWLAFAACVSLLLIYFKGGTTAVKDTRRLVARTGNYYYLALTIVMGIAGPVILGSQLWTCLGRVETFGGLPDWAAGAGAAAAAAAVLWADWIRDRILGGFWSGNVEVKLDHRVAEEGPYRVIRHPIYAAVLMIYTGVLLGFAVWPVAAACGINMAGYLILTEFEDRYLARNLPGYAEYRKRTVWKIIPGVW